MKKKVDEQFEQFKQLDWLQNKRRRRQFTAVLCVCERLLKMETSRGHE